MKVLLDPDPLSEQAREKLSEPLRLIDSAASRLLINELRRYCNQEIAGRSFLIAGHRGAGKTTLTGQAFYEVRRENERLNSSVRPLFVLLHGPSLFQEAAAGVTDQRKALQITLEQIVLSLHRAVAHEVSACYRQRALASPPALRAERLEMAAQLEIELWECPTASRLRELWSRAGVLREGVFFSPIPEDATGLDKEAARREDQGLLELTALSGVCEAYRRISGIFTRQETQQQSNSLKSSLSFAIDSTGKNLFAPLMSVLSGGLAGAGVFLDKGSWLPATLAGFLVALGTSAIFKATSDRARERSLSSQQTFQFNFDVDTLDRVIPMLIRRLLMAGIAPMFVVDELDKLDDSAGQVRWTIGHLKKLVSEQAFFCFLTDRRYFEEMAVRADKEAYSIESSYFSHRLFVSFEPSDLHRYLDNVLVTESIAPPNLAPPAADPASEGAAETKAAELALQGPIKDEELDRQVLTWILLYRSQMHALDLRRLLDEEVRRIGPGEVRTSVEFRLNLTVQVGIEMILASLGPRLRREPEFARLAYDALYYLPRIWKTSEEANLGTEGREPFRQYLAKRSGAAAGEDNFTIAEDDLNLLFDQVGDLAELLASPDVFRQTFENWERVREGLELNSTGILLSQVLRLDSPEPLLHSSTKGIYVWRYRPDGSANYFVLFTDPAAPVNWEEDLEWVTAFASAVERLSSGEINFTTLSSQFRILPISPAWSNVRKAMHHIQQAIDAGDQGSAHRHFFLLRRYADLLRQAGSTITDAILCGAVVGKAADVSSLGKRILLGLSAISSAYRFSEKEDVAIAEDLRKLRHSLAERWPWMQPFVEASPNSEATKSMDWYPKLEEALHEIERSDFLAPHHLPDLRQRLEEPLFSRLEAFFGRSEIHRPGLDEIIGFAAGVRLSQLIKLDLRKMALVDWSDALWASIEDRTPEDSLHCPLWLTWISLRILGFRLDPGGPLKRGLPWLRHNGSFSERSLEKEELRWLDWPVTRRPERSALIIKASNQSLFDTWPPLGDLAAISITPEKAQELMSQFREIKEAPPLEPSVALMAIESSVPEEISAQILEFISRVCTAPPRVVYVYNERPSPSDPVRSPYLIAPKRLEDLFLTPRMS